MRRNIVIRHLGAAILLSFILLSPPLHAQGNMTLRYNRPAEYFEEALVIGNGTMGATIYGGTGKDIKEPCNYCQGRGVEYDTEQLYVDIPAGVYEGATIAIRGAGAPPRGGNGINGDLYVKIHVKPSEEYFREENNLVYKLKLNLIDAWCGCKRTVKCLDGSNISVTVPPLTKSGKNFVVRQRGFESSTPFGTSKGDFIVRVEYEVPSAPLTTEQKKALENFYNLVK